MRTDRQTEMKKLIVDFRNFSKRLENVAGRIKDSVAWVNRV
jgi:hypothetical protein